MTQTVLTPNMTFQHPVSGADGKLLKFWITLMIVFICMQPLSMARLIGIDGIPAILLLSYRGLDLLFILMYFQFWNQRTRIERADLFGLMLVLFTFFYGLLRNGFSITLANDFLIFLLFIVKVVLFRTLLKSLYQHTNPDIFFSRKIKRLIVISMFVAVFVVFLGQMFQRMGFAFYFQTPAEITLPSALSAGFGHMGYFWSFAAFSVISGKRMMLIGILATIVLLIFIPKVISRRVKVYLLAVVAIAVAAAVIAASIPEIANTPILRKLFYTIELTQKAWDNSATAANFFAVLDPYRFLEFAVLRDTLKGWDWVIGAGLGFRYEFLWSLEQLYGSLQVTGDLTNAHFTPIAIISKFGWIGLIFWTFYICRGLTGWRGISAFQISAKIALFSVVIQSLFAFGLFINPITAFLVAVAVTPFKKNES